MIQKKFDSMVLELLQKGNGYTTIQKKLKCKKGPITKACVRNGYGYNEAFLDNLIRLENLPRPQRVEAYADLGLKNYVPWVHSERYDALTADCISYLVDAGVKRQLLPSSLVISTTRVAKIARSHNIYTPTLMLPPKPKPTFKMSKEFFIYVEALFAFAGKQTTLKGEGL